MPQPVAPPPAFISKERKAFKPKVIVGVALVLLVAIIGFFVVLFNFFSSTPPPAKPTVVLAKKVEVTVPAVMKNAATPKAADPVATPAAQTPAQAPATPPEPATSLKTPIDRTQALVAARSDSDQVKVTELTASQATPTPNVIPSPTPSQGTAAQVTPAPLTAAQIPAQPIPTTDASAQPQTQVTQSPTLPTPNATPTPAEPTAKPRLEPAMVPAEIPATPPAVVLREPAKEPPVKEAPVIPQASSAFKRFVADATIKGVFQGNPPRIFINGRTVQAGDIADKSLSITFDRIDAEKKTITFKDNTGATVLRKY